MYCSGDHGGVGVVGDGEVAISLECEGGVAGLHSIEGEGSGSAGGVGGDGSVAAGNVEASGVVEISITIRTCNYYSISVARSGNGK